MSLRTLSAIILILATSGTSLADGLEGPLPTPLPVLESAAEGAEFEGFYANLSYGRVDGGTFENNFGGGSATFDFQDGSAIGGAAGYNAQNGNFVFGGEVRYLSLNGFNNVLPPFGVLDEIESVFDLRGRAGYATGRLLAYGALGYSWANEEPLGPSVALSGLNYGLGFEYNLSDSFFLGADYTWRDLEGASATTGVHADVDTLLVGAGFRF